MKKGLKTPGGSGPEGLEYLEDKKGSAGKVHPWKINGWNKNIEVWFK